MEDNIFYAILVNHIRNSIKQEIKQNEWYKYTLNLQFNINENDKYNISIANENIEESNNETK